MNDFSSKATLTTLTKANKKDQLSQIPNSLSGECQSVGKPI